MTTVIRKPIRNSFMIILLLLFGFTKFGLNAQQSHPTFKSNTVLLFTSSDNETKLPDFELNSLWDLYNATSGTDWMWETNGMIWDFTNDPNPCRDHWQGIGCIAGPNNTLNVHNITLQGYELNGTLPESIGVFSQMHTLGL